MKIICLAIVFMFVGCGYSIDQSVDFCTNKGGFRVYTTITKGMNRKGNIYWNFSDCFPAAKIDSVKAVEYDRAKWALKEFQKIK